MTRYKSIWLVLILIMLIASSCVSASSQSASATYTPTVMGGSGSNGGGSTGGGNSGGSNGGGAGDGGNGGSNGASTPMPTPILTPEIVTGPYTVEQIISLGGEKISGNICDTAQPFSVNVTAPKVPFVFGFIPNNANGGSWAYAYNIASAGETHDASGSYTIGGEGVDGKRLLTMTGSDHVVFKGFNGKMPIIFKFNLVPSQIPDCPRNP